MNMITDKELEKEIKELNEEEYLKKVIIMVDEVMVDLEKVLNLNWWFKENLNTLIWKMLITLGYLKGGGKYEMYL